MLLAAILATALPLPERLYFPAFEPSPLVFELSKPDPRTRVRHYSIDGTATVLKTTFEQTPPAAAHRVDRDRYLILVGGWEKPRLWDAARRTLHEAHDGLQVFALPGFGMVMIQNSVAHGYRVVHVDRDRPQLSVIFESGSVPLAPIGHDGPRLVLLRGSDLVTLKAGQVPRVDPISLGAYQIVQGFDAVRDGKLLVARLPSFETKPCRERPEYYAEVAIYELASRRLRLVGKARGDWFWLLINMETCPTPVLDVRWVREADLSRSRGHGLVVEEWDEVVVR